MFDVFAVPLISSQIVASCLFHTTMKCIHSMCGVYPRKTECTDNLIRWRPAL